MVSLFERCSPSVVHINTSTLRRGFHLDLEEIPTGAGSGFAWDTKHIVTNYHVIKGAHSATVVLSDHTSYEAELVGAEPDCDLAVLRVRADTSGHPPLVPVERGRSSNLHVGQRVLAIGNPFGLDQTLTSGIVSGLGREMKGISGRTIRGVVQTDAAINPGNSGGPLFNARGRLIGVNTMIASSSGNFAGVGFAIPVDTVERVVKQLILYGRTRKAYLGVTLVPDHITKQWSQSVHGGLKGVLVLDVMRGGPADRAGLRQTLRRRDGVVPGDEILAVNGAEVHSVERLMEAVEACSIGDSVEIVYRRLGERGAGEVRAAVQLEEKPKEPAIQVGERGQGAVLVTEPPARSRL